MFLQRNHRLAFLTFATVSSFTAQATPRYCNPGTNELCDGLCLARTMTQTVTVTAVPSSQTLSYRRTIDINNVDGDPQTSLTLDPAAIAPGFNSDGQDVPTDGQVPSLTSTNNFINFCLTVPNFPITNGKQIKTGSCNPAPVGIIPSVDSMPSSKFLFPQNFAAVKASASFTIELKIHNLATGFYVNADNNFLAAPQQIDDQGLIKGHSHVVIEKLDNILQTETTDPQKFIFFKGLNDEAVNGTLTAEVTSGLPVGAYRLSSITTSANHNPVVVAVAQRGSLDDAVYFFVTDNGQPPVSRPVQNGISAGPKPDFALLFMAFMLLPAASILQILSK